LTDGTGICVPIAGTTWTKQAVHEYWSGVASSADGSKLAATVFNGFIYTSGDSGAT
jgi:hypothetical protein